MRRRARSRPKATASRALRGPPSAGARRLARREARRRRPPCWTPRTRSLVRAAVSNAAMHNARWPRKSHAYSACQRIPFVQQSRRRRGACNGHSLATASLGQSVTPARTHTLCLCIAAAPAQPPRSADAAEADGRDYAPGESGDSGSQDDEGTLEEEEAAAAADADGHRVRAPAPASAAAPASEPAGRPRGRRWRTACARQPQHACLMYGRAAQHARAAHLAPCARRPRQAAVADESPRWRTRRTCRSRS